MCIYTHIHRAQIAALQAKNLNPRVSSRRLTLSAITGVLSTFLVYVLRAVSIYSSFVLNIFRGRSSHQAELTLMCHEPKKVTSISDLADIH